MTNVNEIDWLSLRTTTVQIHTYPTIRLVCLWSIISQTNADPNLSYCFCPVPIDDDKEKFHSLVVPYSNRPLRMSSERYLSSLTWSDTPGLDRYRPSVCRWQRHLSTWPAYSQLCSHPVALCCTGERETGSLLTLFPSRTASPVPGGFHGPVGNVPIAGPRLPNLLPTLKYRNPGSWAFQSVARVCRWTASMSTSHAGNGVLIVAWSPLVQVNTTGDDNNNNSRSSYSRANRNADRTHRLLFMWILNDSGDQTVIISQPVYKGTPTMGIGMFYLLIQKNCIECYLAIFGQLT